MVEFLADAVRFHAIHEKTLRLSLAEIARHPYGDGVTVNQALEAGWKQGVAHSMADGNRTPVCKAECQSEKKQSLTQDPGTRI